ncbi:hypothetical protein ACHWQZ_G011837 [Mnemiopsis leidyi]
MSTVSKEPLDIWSQPTLSSMATLLFHLSILHPLSTLPPPLNDPFLPLQIPSSESSKAGPLLLNPSSMPASDTQEMKTPKRRSQLNRPEGNSRAPLTLADLHLEPEDCRTLRQANMLLYDNASDQRRVIILATSDNLNILAESSSWYLQVLSPPLLILSHR